MKEKTYKPGSHPDLPPPPELLVSMGGLEIIYFLQ